MKEKPRKQLIQLSFEPGGYSWEFLVGVCCPALQILTLFQTKKCHFSQPFLDLAFRIHTRFQTYTHFQTKTAQNPYSLGRRIAIGLI